MNAAGLAKPATLATLGPGSWRPLLVLLLFWPLCALGQGQPPVQEEAPSPGEAEAAPLGSVPLPSSPIPERPTLWPRVRVGADLRFSGLLGQTRQVAEELGWGFGLRLSASLLPLGPLSLGFLLDFQQDRFSRTFAEYPDVAQQLVHSTFAVMPQLDLRSRFVHPFLAVGIGASVARHESPLPDTVNQMPTTQNNTLAPLVRLLAGVGVSPLRWLEIGLSFDLSLTFSQDLGGVVRNPAGLLVPGSSTLFAPGWWSSSLYASYNFY